MSWWCLSTCAFRASCPLHVTLQRIQLLQIVRKMDSPAENTGKCSYSSLLIRAGVRFYQHVQSSLFCVGLLVTAHMSPQIIGLHKSCRKQFFNAGLSNSFKLGLMWLIHLKKIQPFPQYLHTWAFSCVCCCLMCFCMFAFWANLIPHHVHMWGFTPLCSSLWLTR